MGRYVPSTIEQGAIDILMRAGYTVVRARTYARLQEKLRVAIAMHDMEIDRREGVERWARRESDEQRRLSRRLDEVCTAAAALGVPITAINEALDKARIQEDS